MSKYLFLESLKLKPQHIDHSKSQLSGLIEHSATSRDKIRTKVCIIPKILNPHFMFRAYALSGTLAS